MKKRADVSIQLTEQGIEKIISESLKNLTQKMRQEATNLSQKFTVEINNMVKELSDKVEKELSELGQAKRTVSLEQMPTAADDGKVYAFQLDGLPGVVKSGSEKVPRDSEDNDDLPDFWRRNFDYGESPYMNLEEIDKITDTPKKKCQKKQ